MCKRTPVTQSSSTYVSNMYFRALFVLGNLTNDVTTTLSEDDTVILELTATVPDVRANENDQQLNVTSLLSYVDPLTKNDLTLPESVGQLVLVDALIRLDVQIASRYVQRSYIYKLHEGMGNKSNTVITARRVYKRIDLARTDDYQNTEILSNREIKVLK